MENNDFTDQSGHRWSLIPGGSYTDGTTGQLILDKAAQAAQDKIYHLVIDLTPTRVVNSVGISRLIHMIEFSEKSHGRIVFCGANPVIAKTLRLMGLLQKATLYATLAETLTDLAQG